MPRPASAAPAGSRLYAVGDIHGRADLLEALLAQITADATAHPEAAKRLIFLGDYVDRGPDSSAVIDRVLHDGPAGLEVVPLMGNHEEMMLRFLEDLAVGRTWMMNGGDATLRSYGVEPPSMFTGTALFRHAQQQFAERLPAGHKSFLEGLAVTHTEGDYLFVHAGVRPGVALEKQRTEDLLWIRDEFLDSDRDFGKVVVHGHSITLEPEFRPNRIGIDTGAYRSNQLTCLVLEGTERTLLTT
ncbi:MAG TPA: metallophosphoesterase family protein [Stellaceae bacterium]|nr:metallophosphoesterase family protein [Stellaceae bacterium]